MTKFQKAVKWLSLVAFIMLAVVLVYEASMPAKVSSSHSGAVSNAVVDTTEKIEGAIGGTKPNTPDSEPTLSEQIRANWGKFNLYIRKGIGHFGAFLVLAIFGTIAFFMLAENRTRGVVVALVLGVSIALITEIIQLYTEGRAGSASDVMLDSFGYVVGCVLTLILFGIIVLVRKRKIARNYSDRGEL